MTSPADEDAFYVAEADGVYRATAATEGPWDPGSQHGGPPAALLASAIEERTGRPGLRTVRVSVDFFGPIALGPVTVSVRVLRPGRRVQLSEAELGVGGRVVAVARAWQHAVADAPDGRGEPLHDPAPALPAEANGPGKLLSGFGYADSVEWRPTHGTVDGYGPGAAWMRPRVPLIAGVPLTGLQRALIVADSANGVSLSLPFDRYLSMPTSLTVSLLRHPVGDWVHLDARTEFAGDGAGLTSADLSDAAGRLGTVSQPLLVVDRG